MMDITEYALIKETYLEPERPVFKQIFVKDNFAEVLSITERPGKKFKLE